MNIDITNRFTLLCLRGRWDPTALFKADELAKSSIINWEDWSNFIFQQNLAPLIYSTVNDRGIIPTSLERSLENSYERNRKLNQIKFDKLTRVLIALNKSGIPHILLKGAALSKDVYADIALRPFTDIDLLIRILDVKLVVDHMVALGYKSMVHADFIDSAVTHHNQIMLIKKDPTSKTLIEVHWSLINSPYYLHQLDMDWFWRSTRKIELFGAPTMIFSPEAQLLHLCAHLELSHSGIKLLWLHDVAEVIEHYRNDIDWDEFIEKVQSNKLILAVRNVLRKVHQDWHVKIPNEIMNRLRDLNETRDEQRVYKLLTDGEHRFLRNPKKDLISTPGWTNRMKYIYELLIPSRTYMAARYKIPHQLIVPFYYPYRWYLIFLKLITS